MKEETICGLDTAQIEELKEKYGALVLVEVEFGGATHQAIFKEPDFKTFKIIGKIAKTDEIEAARAAYDNFIIEADQQIKLRDGLKIKAVGTLMGRMEKVRAEAKNL